MIEHSLPLAEEGVFIVLYSRQGHEGLRKLAGFECHVGRAFKYALVLVLPVWHKPHLRIETVTIFHH